MRTSDRVRQAPRSLARRLIGIGFGLVLAASMVVPAAAFAAPKAACPNVQCVITFGDTAISNRLTALTTLCSKVQAQLTAGHLTSAQAGTIEHDCNTASANYSGLQHLKTTLDAETQISAARKDVLSIFTTYRIYAVVLPRDYHEIWLDILLNVDARLRGVQPKIDAAIQAASALGDKGGEKEKINDAYADFKNQLTAAEGQLDGAQGLIAMLTPSAFDNSLDTYKTDFSDYHNDIRAAHGDITAAAKDLHEIAGWLKDLVSGQAGTGGAPATATVSQ
jgi:hypothetical protein